MYLMNFEMKKKLNKIEEYNTIIDKSSSNLNYPRMSSKLFDL